MTALSEFKKHLRPGMVYRRAELTRWSNAVDRHLSLLQKEGSLQKLSAGLYYFPMSSKFGLVPAEEHALVASFLKDQRFLIHHPNDYNALGLGTTQLHNMTIVYNHKRHGLFKLGGRTFDFRVKPHFPKSISTEFLLVNLVNHVDELGEDRDHLLAMLRKFAQEKMDPIKLRKFVDNYGNMRTKKFFSVG